MDHILLRNLAQLSTGQLLKVTQYVNSEWQSVFGYGPVRNDHGISVGYHGNGFYFALVKK